MDTAFYVLSVLLFSVEVLFCQEDVQPSCPEIGTPATSCQDKCQSSQIASCANGELCCLVKCGYQCIPPDYEVPRPKFKSHYPNYGPFSGSTLIVLTGNFSALTLLTSANLKSIPQDPGTGARGINNDVSLPLNVFSWNYTHIQLMTKYTDDLYIGLTFLIHLDYVTADYKWSTTTDMDFTYRPDPTITGLYPRRAFISGGIALTAVGENLDSVARPVMLVHMERRWNINTDEYTVVGGYTFRSDDTRVYNSTAVVGITPLINTSATENFQTGLNHNGQPEFKRRRRQTGTTEAPDPEIPINSETLEFFIGFELDGVTRYENLSQAIDGETGRLIVYQEPHIEKYKETKKYDPKTESHLLIKGERLTLGATEIDYQVSLGSGTCEVVDLADNAVLCSPPEEEPESSTGEHDLDVLIGYFSFRVGKVEYVKPNDQKLFIIIGCVVGAAVLLAIIVGISAVVCCRKQESPSKASKG